MNTSIRTLALTLTAIFGLSGLAMAAGPNEAGMMDLSPEQQARVDGLHEDFYKKTEAARQELISKKYELDAQLYSANPDEKKIQALTREISDLRAKLYNARVSLRGNMIKEGVTWGHRGWGHRGYGMRGGMGRYGGGPCGEGGYGGGACGGYGGGGYGGCGGGM